MQKHRKVAYAGAESPLKRLCYENKKSKKKQIGYCPKNYIIKDRLAIAIRSLQDRSVTIVSSTQVLV